MYIIISSFECRNPVGLLLIIHGLLSYEKEMHYYLKRFPFLLSTPNFRYAQPDNPLIIGKTLGDHELF